MSLFNRKKSTFFEQIRKLTDNAKVHAVTNRKNSLSALNNGLQNYFENCITALKNKLMNQIEINAKAGRNSAIYRLCQVVADPIVVNIPITNDSIDMSAFCLSMFVSTDVKRKVTIDFNGFTFSGSDLIEFPSAITIVEQLRGMLDFNNFTFKIGTTYDDVKPMTTIIVEW
jgi:hypothetical protein